MFHLLTTNVDAKYCLYCVFCCFIVLDEADRILDMGFSETVNAIIENLPLERQTLLYSATQTRLVITGQ